MERRNFLAMLSMSAVLPFCGEIKPVPPPPPKPLPPRDYPDPKKANGLCENKKHEHPRNSSAVQVKG